MGGGVALGLSHRAWLVLTILVGLILFSKILFRESQRALQVVVVDMG